MTYSFRRLLGISALCMTPVCANAATYTVDEISTGTIAITGDAPTQLVTVSLDFFSLIAGDPTLFSYQETTLNDFHSGFNCNPTCTWIQTLINGDTIFGTFEFTSVTTYLNELTGIGTSIVTGGTGLFAGATGTGTFIADAFFATPTTGTIRQQDTLIVTTATVPEPASLLLTVVGLLGLAGTCRKCCDRSGQ